MADVALSTSDAAPLTAASLTGQAWRLRPVDEGLAQAIARDHGIAQLLARVLLARGIAADDVPVFLNPSLKASLPDPGHLKDMNIAAERLAGAVMTGETIAIFGDYDVDGATASALLARFFRALGKEPIVYIPDRIAEGYGPNTAALLELKTRGAAVVVTVDCGTLAYEPLEAAFEAGLDVIVADHHQGAAQLPKAYAIINPNRLDESSPHRQMAAVGVAFLLAVATHRQLRARSWFESRSEPDLMGLLDLVALGTVCDVVPLTGVNRALVAQGLKVMALRGNPGLCALMDIARVDERPNTYTCGFMLGPRVNAGGRVGKADFGARLLSTDNLEEAQTLAKALDEHNDERKGIEMAVLADAMARAEAQIDEPLFVLAAEGWHPGVIGIVAGRIKERFRKPVAVIALNGDSGKASARSIPGFDFGAAVIAARDSGLLREGGGHSMAAGFSVEAKHIPALQAFFSQRLTQQMKEIPDAHTVWADGCIALSGVNIELAYMLEQAAPFGQGNAHPRLVLQHVQIAQVTPVGNDGAHLRLILADDEGRKLTAMCFRPGPALMKALPTLIGKRVHVLGQLKINMWQGREEARFNVEDVAVSE